MPALHPALEAAALFRAALLRQERAQAARFVRAYGEIYRVLLAQIDAMVEDIMQDPPRVKWRAGQLRRWKRLEQDIVNELTRYGAYVDTELRQALQQQIALGLRHAEALVTAGWPDELIEAMEPLFQRLPAEAVINLLGFTAPDSPLHAALVDQLGPAVAEAVKDKIATGLALGWGPRKTATEIRRALGQGLTWALRTVRTSQLWAYREANRAYFVANEDIIEGWIWYATLGDPRTCVSCIAMHGTFHTNDEVLNDHYNGRCAMIPKTRSWAELGLPDDLPESGPQVQSGRDWFDGLSDAEQQGYMGEAKWRAWKDGAISWDDLTATHDDTVYGPMRVEASLKEILGEGAKDYYRSH